MNQLRLAVVLSGRTLRVRLRVFGGKSSGVSVSLRMQADVVRHGCLELPFSAGTKVGAAVAYGEEPVEQIEQHLDGAGLDVGR